LCVSLHVFLFSKTDPRISLKFRTLWFFDARNLLIKVSSPGKFAFFFTSIYKMFRSIDFNLRRRNFILRSSVKTSSPEKSAFLSIKPLFFKIFRFSMSFNLRRQNFIHRVFLKFTKGKNYESTKTPIALLPMVCILQ